MGKYIRKPKTCGDVAVKDASQPYLGVRTRAKTLALQRLQSSSADVSPPPKIDYLELRSRRLEKSPLLCKKYHNSRKTPAAEESPDFEKSAEDPSPEPAALTIEPSGGVDNHFDRLNGGGSEMGDTEIPVSLGENHLDLDDRERATRESSPSSLNRPDNIVSTPGSSSRPVSPNSRVQSANRDIPTTHEVEEFFAQAELPHQLRFMEKYNFDIVNDLPLAGRYDWVKSLP